MTKMDLNALLLAVVLSLVTTAALADGTNESSGIQSTNGNASPTTGFSSTTTGIGTGTTTTTNSGSNVDDYTNQNDQININGGEDSVVKVLRVNQKNLVNDYVVRTFPIKHATASEIRNAFRQVTAMEGGRAEVIRDKEKKESFLWVVAPKFQIPFIEQALARLDESWVQDNVDGSEAAYFTPKFRGVTAIVNDVLAPSAAATVAGGDDNYVQLDTVANSALIQGEPFRVSSFIKYANQVDIPVPQMFLEAKVYEVEVSDEKRIGLDYIAWKNGPGRNLFDFIFWGSTFEQSAHNKTSIFDPFVASRGNVVGNQDFNGESSGWWMGANYLLTSSYIDFLQGVGRARMVTKGEITARTGQTGTFSAVDQVLYFQAIPNETNTPTAGIVPGMTASTPAATAPGSTAIPVYSREVDKNQYIQIGLTLTARPYIAEETSEVQLSLTLNDIVGQTSSGTPQVRNNSLTTTVLVRNGQPFVVGGIRRTEDVKNTQRMPVLGSIPILGFFFGHEATVKRQTELVIILTPKIKLGTEADQEMASDEHKLIRDQVEKRVKLTLPATELGFDQWLIGS